LVFKPWKAVTWELVMEEISIEFMEIGSENVKRIQVAQKHVIWWPLISTKLNLHVPLPVKRPLFSK
jgi:hypothetical protein